MKIYLAAPGVYQFEMQVLRRTLELEEHIVTSRWLDQENVTHMEASYAQMDLDDIDASDVLVVRPLRKGTLHLTGGHHVEFGYAIAKKKHLIVFGEPTSIFQTLPQVHHVNSLAALLNHLSTLAPRESLGARLVIVESPYAGDIEANVNYARRAVRDSLSRGEAPIASHLLYTQPGILDDAIPAERQWGIDAGLAWHAAPNVTTVVYKDLGISRGMAYGIAHAEKMGNPVEYRLIGAEEITS